MDRRSFFRGTLIASAVAGVEVTRASSAGAFFWWFKLDEPCLQVAGVKFTVVSLTVKAGCMGAPGGFTVQWMKKSDFNANCQRWYRSSDPRLCKAVFVPTDCDSPYYLSRYESVTVPIGGLPDDVTTNCPALEPQTEYIFRAFAHATGCFKTSTFSCSVCATTEVPDRPPV